MNKYKFILAALVFTSCSAFSQDLNSELNLDFKPTSSLKKGGSSGFQHEAGGFYGLFLTRSIGNIELIGDYGIHYRPRLNFEISNKSSFSVEILLSLGLNWAVNSRSGAGGVFSFQAPVKGTINLGLGANDTDSFGFYAGAGLGTGYYAYDSVYDAGGGFGVGLYLDTGVRFDTDKSGVVNVGVSTTLGNQDLNIYNVTISTPL